MFSVAAYILLNWNKSTKDITLKKIMCYKVILTISKSMLAS